MLTKHAILTADEFVRLRTSLNQDEYAKSAHGTATDEVWLEVISRFPEMRRWVAYNKTVPLSILGVLMDDSNPSVRSAVALKRKITIDMIERLVLDPDPSVRSTIAAHFKLPPHLVDVLKDDPDPVVRKVARGR